MLYQIEMSSFISDFDAEKLFRSLVRSEMNASSLKVLKHRYEVVIWSVLILYYLSSAKNIPESGHSRNSWKQNFQ